MKHSGRQPLVWHVYPLVVLGALLALVPPGTLAQHFAGGHSGGFNGGRVAGFSGSRFRGSFSAPRSFSGFPVSAPRAFGIAPRMSWTASHYSFIPQRGAYAGYRPLYRVENRRGWNHRGPYRRPYLGYSYGGYPYAYANSWELLPWDLGYPDFTGYGEDNGASEPNNVQVQPPYEEQQQPPQEEESYRPDYAPAPYQSPANQAVASTPLQNQPQLTLIFKDGHTQAIQNYVLTPKDVIIMDDAASGRIPRIALSALNLPATEQAALQNGLDFSPPSL